MARRVELGMRAFDRWVNDNNIPETYEYGKGWWDYIELVRRFAERVEANDVRVIGHYVIDTPPPCERLPMPAVSIAGDGFELGLRFDFGRFSLRHDMREWAVSIRRHTPYTGPLFGLFQEDEDLRQAGLDGLLPDHVFGPYRENPARFTVLLRDEWDVAMLVRIVTHEQ
jgi:hypothetical protein